MLQENVIEVKDVKKQFRVYPDKGNSLKEKILFRERNSYEVREVLKGISFNIKKGEAVGLVGHNGCGKSTTLKLLTKIMYPDSGSIKMVGRVSSLLELGAGFHPDMSGRDNIFINASIFGLTRKEIETRMNRIIEFSELGNYIDNPVRTYSSGMYMRLAFSVAINVNADILLIDEILAVGDANFQKKCMDKMRQIKKQGTTIVLVSHSLQQIESICDRSIWINDGIIMEDGFPYSVHVAYLRFMSKNQVVEEVEEEIVKDDKKEICLDSIRIRNRSGDEQKLFELREMIRIDIFYKVMVPIKGNINVSIVRKDGVRCYGTNYKKEQKEDIIFDKSGVLSICFQNVALLTNEYKVSVVMESEDGREICFDDSAEFEIKSGTEERGVFQMEHVWEKGEGQI